MSSMRISTPPGAVCIDGAQLEGGGQILRNAAALAAVLVRPLFVHSIRAGRSKPGLAPQHATGLQLVAALCCGVLDGAQQRSSAITLTPTRPPRAGDYVADTTTAGSVTLLAQQALPCLFLATERPGFAAGDARSRTSRIILRGGTDTTSAPPLDYTALVLLPTLRDILQKAGAADVQLRLLRRGHYPRGGGEAELTVCALPQGTTLPCWQLTTRGSLVRIDGRAHAAGRQRPDVAERMAAAAARTLRAALADAPDAILHGCTKWAGTGGSVAAGSTICSGAADSTGHVVVDVRVAPEAPERAISGDGGGITLVATTDSGMRLGASALAERGLSAEAVGELAAQRLVDTLHSGAAVDTWLQDQLVVFMALANGPSTLLCGEPSLHTRTAIAVCTQLLPSARFSITRAVADAGAGDDGGGGLWLLHCEGAGVPAGGGADVAGP